MPSDGLGGPICVGCDYPHSCAVLVINKGVRATVVVDDYELQLGSWQPLQRRGNVARPNAPPGSVFKLDDMTLVVLCNQHTLAPSSQNDSIAPRIWVLPESPRRVRVWKTHCLKLLLYGLYQASRARMALCQREGRVEASSPPPRFWRSLITLSDSICSLSSIQRDELPLMEKKAAAHCQYKHGLPPRQSVRMNYSAAARVTCQGGSRRPPLIQWLSLSR